MASKMGNGTMNIISGKPTAMGVFALLVATAVALALIHALPALAQEPNAGPLAGFTLVDASDQTELATLTEGVSVEIADPDGGSYGIRADLAEGESVGSVSLELSGAKSVGPKTENLAPYSLYGDHRSGATRRLDGESLPAGSYTLTATAYAESSLGGDELGTLEVSFTIAQTNRAPVFGSATYNFSVAEDAAIGAAVGTASATDADDDGITYTIESGNGDGKFAINGDSGAITLAGELDYEEDTSHTLTVQASDDDGGTDTATVNVSVTDVDENSPPAFGSATYNFSIAEDAAIGAAVGTASATDADDDGITYTIESGNGDGKFAINGDSGAITLAGELDYEEDTSHTLTVQASDDDGGTDTATVNVSVTDVAESSPGPLTGFTLVDASDQSVLATLTDGASVELADPDGGSYAVRADVDTEATIGSVELSLSGAKSVSRTENLAPYSLYGDHRDGESRNLDGESLPAGSYNLTATAYANRNLGGDELGTLEISFTITKANNAPEFGSVTYNFSIAEDAAIGAAVGTASATDADDDGITYTIESGNGEGKFAINGDSGAITLAGELDYESDPSHALTVQASDDDGGTDTATVNVSVTDVAESSPGPLTGFTLVDASDQSVLATLTDGASVELADPDGGSYAVRAGVDTEATIGSVELSLSGAKSVSRTENAAPYSLYGYSEADGLDGASLPAGGYTLTATAYAESDLGGDELGTLEASFTVSEPPVSALEHGTTADGVSYVRFMKSASEPVPDPQSELSQDAAGAVGRAAMAQRNAGGATVGTVSVEYLRPHGLWSDGDTLWVSALESGDWYANLYAYVLGTGTRVADKDIELDIPDMSDPYLVELRDTATGIWMNDDTVWASAGRIDAVLAYHRNDDVGNDVPAFAAGDRKSDEDFDDLGAPNEKARTPVGLWSDGENMYIAEFVRTRIYVHNLETQAHVKTLLTSGGNNNPVGLWSDGTTMWVSDRFGNYIDNPEDVVYEGHDQKVYAYTLDGWQRAPHLDFNTSTENLRPRGIWSNGTKMWVADAYSDKVFVYELPTDTRLKSLAVSGVNLDAFSPEITEYSRNVAGDITRVTVAADAYADDATVEITPRDAVRNTQRHEVNLVRNGVTTITVTVTNAHGSRDYTLTLTQLEGTTGTLSDDATLSSLSTEDVTMSPTFDSAVTEYRYTMTTHQIVHGLTTRVLAKPNHTGATVTITPDDNDDDHTNGHQVALDGEINAVIDVRVDSQDGSATQTYTLRFRAISRDSDKDIPAGNIRRKEPHDIWSDGETLWTPSNQDITIYAYDLDTGARRSGKDYRRTVNPWNWVETGLWSDGDTMWITGTEPWSSTVVDAIDAQSYNPVSVLDGESFLDEDGWRGVRDIWSDGETFWASWIEDDSGGTARLVGGVLKAYDFETKARKSTADIPINTTGTDWGNYHEKGSFNLWSDGTLLWVVSNWDNSASRLEAHRLADGERVPGMDIPVGEDGMTRPGGMWSDGRTMWVLSTKWSGSPTSIYAYALPPNAKLFSLELSDVDFGHFIHGRPNYTAEVANDVDVTTITYEQAFTDGLAAVAISATDEGGGIKLNDFDGGTDGYQVNLATGENVITITVTAPNGTDTYAYTVTITRASS